MEIQTTRKTGRHWYLLLMLGILFVVLGIWVFRTPIASNVALAFLFAYLFLITGILEIIYAVINRNFLDGWGWALAGGIMNLLVGVLLLARGELTLLILPFFVGFGLLFRSTMSIVWAVELRKYRIPNWAGLLVIGILGVVFSFILLWNPLFAGMTIVVYTALALIFAGISYIYTAFQLRK